MKQLLLLGFTQQHCPGSESRRLRDASTAVQSQKAVTAFWLARQYISQWIHDGVPNYWAREEIRLNEPIIDPFLQNQVARSQRQIPG